MAECNRAVFRQCPQERVDRSTSSTVRHWAAVEDELALVETDHRLARAQMLLCQGIYAADARFFNELGGGKEAVDLPGELALEAAAVSRFERPSEVRRSTYAIVGGCHRMRSMIAR